jgi:uncharacterized protein YjiS (DUF1127 family)
MSRHIENAGRSAVGFNPIAALVDGVFRMGETLHTWQKRADERTRLGELDDRMLKDIGIHPSDAAREADKAFWRR